MSWDPTRFSNTAVWADAPGAAPGAAPIRAAEDRRYAPACLPYNNSANAGQVYRRPGERVAGWEVAADTVGVVPGAITAAEMDEGTIRGVNPIARADARGILSATLKADAVTRAELLGVQGQGQGAAAQTGHTGVPTAGLWQGGMSEQDPTAHVGRTSGLAPSAGASHGSSSIDVPPAPPARHRMAVQGALWPQLDTCNYIMPPGGGGYATVEWGAAGGSSGGGGGPGSGGGGGLGPSGGGSGGSGAGGGSLGPGGGTLRLSTGFGSAFGGGTDLEVGSNAMADTGYPEGDLAMGIPRRQDMGIMLSDAASTRAWRGLVAADAYDGCHKVLAREGWRMTGNDTSQGIAGGLLNRALATLPPVRDGVDARWDDGKYGMGMGVDAAFMGVYVDPYTGVEYDTFENEAPPPQKDMRLSDSGMQRHFEAMMGGWAPGRPIPKKVEVVNDWSEAYPDVPDRDWVEYARARGAEAARRADVLGPHRDDAAWTDGEGYASLPTREMDPTKIGYNDAVRTLPLPALHLHGGLIANPMTGGGIDPGTAGEGGFMPPQVAVRVKKAPVFSARGGIGGGHLEGAGTGALATWDPTLRAPVRIGGYGEAAVYGGAATGEGAYMGSLAAWDPTLRAPVRIGHFGEAATDGGATAGEGAYMGSLAQQRDPLRAPVRVGQYGETFVDGAAVAGQAGYTAPDVLTEQLSQRPKMVAALGRAFTNLMLEVEGGAVPPAHMPASLRFAANNPMTLGRAIIDLGLTGPGTAGLADYSELKAPHRATDMRAMAVGDVGMALLSGLEGAGPAMPPEVHELTTQERDALTLALGRAIVHMVGSAEYEAGQVGWTAPGDVAGFGTTIAPTLRAPEVAEALGRLAIQLADDAGAMYMPPEDWAAPQSGGRGLRENATAAVARALGRRLGGIAAEVEGAGTGGLMRFADPLRGDSIIAALAARGITADVEGAGTSMLADPDALRKRKLDAYTAAIAARLYGLNANAEEAGPGTGALTQQTHRLRPLANVPIWHTSAPFHIVDGGDGGLRLDVGAPTLRPDEVPNARRAGPQPGTETMPGAAPSREGDYQVRPGHRFGDKPIATRGDYFAGGGVDPALHAGFTELDSKYEEVVVN